VTTTRTTTTPTCRADGLTSACLVAAPRRGGAGGCASHARCREQRWAGRGSEGQARESEQSLPARFSLCFSLESEVKPSAATSDAAVCGDRRRRHARMVGGYVATATCTLRHARMHALRCTSARNARALARELPPPPGASTCGGLTPPRPPAMMVTPQKHRQELAPLKTPDKVSAGCRDQAPPATTCNQNLSQALPHYC